MALQSILGLVSRPNEPMYKTGRSRIYHYARWRRLYDGYTVKEDSQNNIKYKRLKHNPSHAITNIQAEFLAGQPIKFQVANDPEATTLANDIWKRSAGDEAFGDNALLGMIYGDACIMPDRNDDDEVILKWIDSSIGYPLFDGRNRETVTDFVIAWVTLRPEGGFDKHFQQWAKGVITEYQGDEMTPKHIGTYDPSKFDGGVPVAWIRNLTMKGDLFGRSVMSEIDELTEEYDHLMRKKTDICDYYANPNIYMKGVRKPDSLSKGVRTVYFLPADGDMGFVEWKGTPQSFDDHVSQLRNNISELTSTPIIAFSNFEFKSSDISGVALKVLFGPLLKRTDRQRQTWGGGIRKAMRWAMAESGKDVKLEDITILWSSPLPNNTKEDWEIYVMKTLEGISNKQIQREAGYTEDEIKEMEADYQAEAIQKADVAIYEARGIAEAQAEFAPEPSTGGAQQDGQTTVKKQSAKQKTDHTTKTTVGKITNVTGEKGAV